MGSGFLLFYFVGAYMAIWRSKVDPDAINDKISNIY